MERDLVGYGIGKMGDELHRRWVMGKRWEMGKLRLKTTGYRLQRGPSVAPNRADSGGAFSFAKASENALEGSRWKGIVR
jgi:hypothetical protein